MVRSKRASPLPPLRGRPPAVKAGGMRVPKKHEYGPVGKNAKPPGKDKTSAIASFSKPQNMGVLVAEALSKMTAVESYYKHMKHSLLHRRITGPLRRLLSVK
ncbi:death-associated protein-like 1 isoform X2 [Lathamus discolor]|uniref:death-associated protein-like 1 isoform X2 n=1 Tax=Lathamus discolor TaxID=678569 RepID=UPI0032B78DE4